MSDLRTLDQMEWLQEGLYLALLACDLFAPLNIVLERQFHMDKSLAREAIWTTLRNGQTGAGLLVEMPRLTVPQANSQVNHLLGSVVVFEERNLNLVPGVGTGKSAEQWAQMAMEFMRGWIIGQAGGLVPETSAIMPAKDWQRAEDGIIALRASISQKISRPIIPRCEPPVFSLANNIVTLVNGASSPAAQIYFTTDGSFPGLPESAGELGGISQAYSAPFPVAPGQLIHWLALEPGKFPSHVGTQLIS